MMIAAVNIIIIIETVIETMNITISNTTMMIIMITMIIENFSIITITFLPSVVL